MIKKAFLLFIIMLFVQASYLPAWAQVPGREYHNLIFEGGGIRGIAYGGALLELEEEGLLQPVQRVAGTSAGAITAALLAVGYSAREITAIIYRAKLEKFSDGRLIFFGGINRLVKNYGWYRGDRFTSWMEQLIEHKTGNADITFEGLHHIADTSNFRDLYITGTNLTKQQAVVFSYETYPKMKIKDAVRISMAIPLFFKAVLVDSTGNIVDKNRKGQGVDVMVDGGIIANFPITIFDSTQYVSKPYATDGAATENTYLFNEETLGIRLDRVEQIKYDEQHLKLAPYEIETFKDFVGAFYNIVIESLNRNNLTAKDWDRTISINTLDVAPKIRKLSAREKAKLIESGRQSVITFLARRK